jgi:glucose-6-phosphate-specific signal transduction histidine kinase
MLLLYPGELYRLLGASSYVYSFRRGRVASANMSLLYLSLLYYSRNQNKIRYWWVLCPPLILFTFWIHIDLLGVDILVTLKVAMCCHTMYLGKKFFFSHYCKKKMRSWKNTTSTSRTCASSSLLLRTIQVVMDQTILLAIMLSPDIP